MSAPMLPQAKVVDPLTVFDAGRRAVLSAVADHLIPAGHGMPSAAEVVEDDRLRFVFTSRPDLVEPVVRALRPGLGDEVATRLAALERDEPGDLAALQLVIVGGYYTDKRVRELIGYPGQEAIEVRSWLVPEYIDEGLIDAVISRGPVWRDPTTGSRAVAAAGPRRYAERFIESAAATEGGDDGHHGS
jgi:hypothetical protein